MYGKNIRAKKTKDGVKFSHYAVVKKSDAYFAVCDASGTEITSGTSLEKACKKAKLLEIGYMQARDILSC